MEVKMYIEKHKKSIEFPQDSKQLQQRRIRDGGFGWTVVIASLISHMLTDGIIYSYGVLAPEFIKHYEISRSTVGWMGSALISVTLTSGLFASYLCELFSYRSVAVLGSIISVIGFASPYFYNSLWFVVVSSSIICGIGFGLVYLPSIVIVNIWFKKKRALALGIAVCGSGLGTFTMSHLLEFLVTKYEWQLTMLITGIILLILIPCSLFYITKTFNCLENSKTKRQTYVTVIEVSLPVKERNKEENVNVCGEINTEIFNKGSAKKISSDDSNVTNPKQTTLEILFNPLFVLLVLSNFLVGIGFNAPYMFTKDRAILSGISSVKGSFLISSIGIGNCLGRVGFGFLATQKYTNRFHLNNISLIISGFVLIFSWGITNYIFLILYNLVFGLMTGAFVTLNSILFVDCFGLKNLNKTFGLCLVFQGMSVLIGPPFTGWIYDKTLSYNFAFAICGLFIVFGGVIMYLAYLSDNFRNKDFN